MWLSHKRQGWRGKSPPSAGGPQNSECEGPVWKRGAVGENLQLASPARVPNSSSSFTSAWVFSNDSLLSCLNGHFQDLCFHRLCFNRFISIPFRSFLEHIPKSYSEVLVFYFSYTRISQGLPFSVAGLWWEQTLLVVTDYIFTLISRCLRLELL